MLHVMCVLWHVTKCVRYIWLDTDAKINISESDHLWLIYYIGDEVSSGNFPTIFFSSSFIHRMFNKLLFLTLPKNCDRKMYLGMFIALLLRNFSILSRHVILDDNNNIHRVLFLMTEDLLLLCKCIKILWW